MKQVFKMNEISEGSYYIQYDPEPSKKLIISVVSILLPYNPSEPVNVNELANVDIHLADMIESITSASATGIEGYTIYGGSGGFASINLPEYDGHKLSYESFVFELDYKEIERHIILENI
jgi:hypothetical protein